MDQGSKIPLSHTLWSPHDTVKDAAEALGINLPDEAAKNLAMDVEYRIHEILEVAIKFMRHSKRKLLMTNDINYALKMLNVEPLYGYDNSQPLSFREALVGAGGQTLYYVDDNEIDLEKLINQELPRVPRQTTFTAHWLAIEGIQPIIPQNPLPSEVKSLPPIVRGATSSMLGNDILSGAGELDSTKSQVADKSKKSNDKDTQIRPLVKHVLSKELKLYFDKVVEVLTSTDPEKESLKGAALTSLRNDPGLHQLVPYFIQFVAEQITNQLRNIDVLYTMLEVISALAENTTLFLDPYVHALMPCILTLLLAKRIGATLKEVDDDFEEALKSQLAVREFAAILLDHIIKVYGSSYSTLRSRVTRTLLRALLDSSKPTGTHYGALLGLKKLGSEVIRLVLVGNLKVWSRSVITESNKTEFEKNILLNTALDCLRLLKVGETDLKGTTEMANQEIEDVDQSKIKESNEQPKKDRGDSKSGESISEETKEKLFSRISEPLSSLVLSQDDSACIVNGIFFGNI